MATDLKQIGNRIKGLRESLELSTSKMSYKLEVDEKDYILYETGEKDISISFLQRIEREFNVDISVLMFGEEPHMSSYFVTRKNKGVSVERVSAYKYQSLTAGFSNNVAEVFMVTVDPKPEDTDYFKNIHAGQEFNMVVEGSMSINKIGRASCRERV